MCWVGMVLRTFELGAPVFGLLMEGNNTCMVMMGGEMDCNAVDALISGLSPNLSHVDASSLVIR